MRAGRCNRAGAKKAPAFFICVMQKNDYEKTCTKKHEKHVQKTCTKKQPFFLCFYFFSSAENNREKQAYRKNKPVQKTSRKNNGRKQEHRKKTSVQKNTRKKQA